MKICDIFLIFAQSIDRGYTLESPLCFRATVRKNVYPCKSQFYHIKVGCKGYTLHGHVNMNYMMPGGPYLGPKANSVSPDQKQHNHGVQRRMISMDNFFVFLRILFSALLLVYVT